MDSSNGHRCRATNLHAAEEPPAGNTKHLRSTPHDGDGHVIDARALR